VLNKKNANDSFVAVLRSAVYQYVSANETFIRLYNATQDYDLEMDREYGEFILENGNCTQILPSIADIADEMCQCYDEIRAPLSVQIKKDPILLLKFISCTKLDAIQPYAGKILVVFSILMDCLEDDYQFLEVAVQAISGDAFPVGLWHPNLKNGEILACPAQHTSEEHLSFIIPCAQKVLFNVFNINSISLYKYLTTLEFLALAFFFRDPYRAKYLYFKILGKIITHIYA